MIVRVVFHFAGHTGKIADHCDFSARHANVSTMPRGTGPINDAGISDDTIKHQQSSIRSHTRNSGSISSTSDRVVCRMKFSNSGMSD